jgi:hypothetical protein
MANDMKVKIRLEKGDGEVIEVDGTSVIFYLIQNEEEALAGVYGDFSIVGLARAGEVISGLFDRTVESMAKDAAEQIIGGMKGK